MSNMKNNTKRNSAPYFVIGGIVLVMIIGCLVGLLFFFDTLSGNPINNKKDKTPSTDIKLQYTETSKSNTEGVYITDVSDVVENVMPSIVSITSKTLVTNGMYGPSFWGNSGNQYATGAGSGIIVSQDDKYLYILTNNHVIEDASSLAVQFIDDESVDATVIGASSNKDVAIIAVPLSDLKEETTKVIKMATMGSSTDLKVGQGVIAIGNALGYGQSVTTGVISALNREVSIDNTNNKMIQIDAAINGGNSGGALLNSSGQVIGINSAKYSSSGYSNQASIEGMGFAIPISDVTELIESLMNGESDPNSDTNTNGATIGIEGAMVTEAMSSYYGMPIGFYISNVRAGSGAEKAKLETGNIVIGIDGKEVTSFEVISEYLATKNAGDKIKLEIAYTSGNGYKKKDVIVTLS